MQQAFSAHGQGRTRALTNTLHSTTNNVGFSPSKSPASMLMLYSMLYAIKNNTYQHYLRKLHELARVIQPYCWLWPCGVSETVKEGAHRRLVV